ncbi:ricin-type beta-trefoil lectin domain protein [Actinoplanes sp. NPDC023801]|uniref:RICIN domain-containing protein n=1 Tax=Actinoplanes sp. NPDC023801 TaxID=3154595 RepID=UPI0033E31A03
MIGSHRRRCAAPLRCRDDCGFLPLALLLILVSMSMSALLAPVVVGQIVNTRTASERTLALRTAQAGIHIAMGQLRAAADNSGTGDPLRLPAGPFTGSIGPHGNQRYQVAITYRDLDGNTLTSPLQTQPASAVLVSTGITAASGVFGPGTLNSRTMQAIYTFRVSNQNIPGGQIHVRSSTVDLCLDAGTAQPSAGTVTTMQRCSGSPAQQIWAYNSDLTIALVSSKTGSNPLGMCLDAGFPHTSGAQVKLQKCSEASPAAPRQQWSSNDSANLMGTSDGATLDGYCFNVNNPDASGSLVVLSNSRCYGNYDNVQTFQPDPGVGAGAAGAATKQLVNYQQFGRCLDVTDQYTGSAYLIAWPCKQAPNAANVTWNQKWTLPAINATTRVGTGRIYITVNGGDYCLRTPGTTAWGAYPVLVACSPSSGAANLIWTVYGSTGTYTTSHQIVDNTGLCLTPTNPALTPTEVYNGAWYTGPPISRIVMRTCDGSAWQKWNAPPDLSRPLPLTQIHER